MIENVFIQFLLRPGYLPHNVEDVAPFKIEFKPQDPS